ncbi:MAG: hypothetical protein K2X09_03295 [Rickettsiales bacterium]|nr:hypothetical protein [Rickettsiales bacterium]
MPDPTLVELRALKDAAITKDARCRTYSAQAKNIAEDARKHPDLDGNYSALDAMLKAYGLNPRKSSYGQRSFLFYDYTHDDVDHIATAAYNSCMKQPATQTSERK